MFKVELMSFYLLLYGFESVVGRSQTVAVWGESGSSVGFYQWERSLVLLPRNLQQELNPEQETGKYRNSLKLNTFCYFTAVQRV